jgi:hypothetical protein
MIDREPLNCSRNGGRKPQNAPAGSLTGRSGPSTLAWCGEPDA